MKSAQLGRGPQFADHYYTAHCQTLIWSYFNLDWLLFYFCAYGLQKNFVCSSLVCLFYVSSWVSQTNCTEQNIAASLLSIWSIYPASSIASKTAKWNRSDDRCKHGYAFCSSFPIQIVNLRIYLQQ